MRDLAFFAGGILIAIGLATFHVGLGIVFAGAFAVMVALSMPETGAS